MIRKQVSFQFLFHLDLIHAYKRQRSCTWATPEVIEAYFSSVGEAEYLSSDFILPTETSERDLDDYRSDHCSETERYVVSKTNQTDQRDVLDGPEEEHAVARADLPANLKQGPTLGKAVLNAQFEEFLAFGNFRACEALVEGEGKIQRGGAKDPKYRKEETTGESQQVNPLPSTPARATQPHNEKIDSPPDTLSTALSESEDDDHPPSDVNTSPPSVHVAELREICLPDTKGESESGDGNHSPSDVHTTPLSINAAESIKIFWSDKKDLFENTWCRLCRTIDLAMGQTVLETYSEFREYMHTYRTDLFTSLCMETQTDREVYLQFSTESLLDELLATAGENSPNLVSDRVLQITNKWSLFTIAEEPEEILQDMPNTEGKPVEPANYDGGLTPRTQSAKNNFLSLPFMQERPPAELRLSTRAPIFPEEEQLHDLEYAPDCEIPILVVHDVHGQVSWTSNRFEINAEKPEATTGEVSLPQMEKILPLSETLTTGMSEAPQTTPEPSFVTALLDGKNEEGGSTILGSLTITVEPLGECALRSTALVKVAENNIVDLAYTADEASSKGTKYNQPELEMIHIDLDLLSEAMAETKETVDPVLLAQDSQEITAVSVKNSPLGTANRPESQKTGLPPAEIILIGGTMYQNNPQQWLISFCKGVYNRLPTLSTCALYCAVAIYMIVMHLAELTKRNKATLESMMGYLWSSPWSLLFTLITGTGQLVLDMMVVFSFMLMACDPVVTVEGPGRHEMEVTRT
jgi:hypothetical protein